MAGTKSLLNWRSKIGKKQRPKRAKWMLNSRFFVLSPPNPRYNFFLTIQFFGVKLTSMEGIHKKITAGALPIPFLFAIIFCCCLKDEAFAEEHHSNLSTENHQELKRSHHSEHQEHSQGDHECACPKHLSFFSEQFADIIFDSSLSQRSAKNFMANHWFKNIVLISSLANHSPGPPQEDRADQVSLPSYLKISNLRI